MSLKPCRNTACPHFVDTELRGYFCSNACKMKVYRQKKAAHKPMKKQTIKRCRNCGLKFSTLSERKQFCSDSCRANFHQQQKRLMMKAGNL